jgi:hypothetical protein
MDKATKAGKFQRMNNQVVYLKILNSSIPRVRRKPEGVI